MYGLFLSLFLLGLSAIDPVGIAAMPVLLTQQHPLLRSGLFLVGSFVALVLMGLIFAQGVGLVVLQFETSHPWVVPVIELGAGVLLLVTALLSARQPRSRTEGIRLPTFVTKWLSMKGLQLFLLGAAVVVIQSLIDIVFIVAMIHVEQLQLPAGVLFLAVTTYAIAALLLQLVVVMVYRLTPASRREAILSRVNYLTGQYGNRAIVGVSLVFGVGLLANGFLSLGGHPLF